MNADKNCLFIGVHLRLSAANPLFAFGLCLPRKLTRAPQNRALQICFIETLYQEAKYARTPIASTVAD
jgi:hypothetical protein